MTPAIELLLILCFTLVLFVWGKWRYDVVAFVALALSTVFGFIPYRDVFSGFSNPAVITVACVMLLSDAISRSGILDIVIRALKPLTKHTTLHVGVLCVLSAFLSAFMNNVGALAIVLPIALETSRLAKRSPSVILMPIAFASAMGGLLTVIGTPPNILISAYRQTLTGQPYHIFDFSSVGGPLVIAALLFIIFVGWRLVPERLKASDKDADDYSIEDYLVEVKIIKDSIYHGMELSTFEASCDNNIFVTGLIRKKRKQLILHDDDILMAGDILIVEADPKELEQLLKKGGVELVTTEQLKLKDIQSNKVALFEAVIPPGSQLEGRTISGLRLRYRFHLHCLALSRQGKMVNKRLRNEHLKAGDVLLLQGDNDTARDNIVSVGLLPLAERNIQIGNSISIWLPITIFILSILAAATGLFPIQVSFMLAVLVLVLTNNLPLKTIYQSIEWPIIMLLGAMIPVGIAMQSSGGTKLITDGILMLAPHVKPVWILAGVLVITMTLSDLMNNAATAVVMAPIAASIATSLHVHVDPFLMAVAIGASCSFLTPIGHQNNTLVMGPGGYKFIDYMRLGLPVEIIIICVSMPLLMMAWPLH